MQSSEETSYIFCGILYYNEVSMCLQMLAPYLNILFPDFSGSWKLSVMWKEDMESPFQKELKISPQKIQQNIVIHNQVILYFLGINENRQNQVFILVMNIKVNMIKMTSLVGSILVVMSAK